MQTLREMYLLLIYTQFNPSPKTMDLEKLRIGNDMLSAGNHLLDAMKSIDRANSILMGYDKCDSDVSKLINCKASLKKILNSKYDQCAVDRRK